MLFFAFLKNIGEWVLCLKPFTKLLFYTQILCIVVYFVYYLGNGQNGSKV